MAARRLPGPHRLQFPAGGRRGVYTGIPWQRLPLELGCGSDMPLFTSANNATSLCPFGHIGFPEGSIEASRADGCWNR